MAACNTVARLWDVKPDHLIQRLTTIEMELSGKITILHLDSSTATARRDWLARSMYARLFDWITVRIDTTMSQGTGLGGESIEGRVRRQGATLTLFQNDGFEFIPEVCNRMRMSCC